MSAHDVVVVGAGLSGLYCAWKLHQAGHDVVVVEARDRVGGRTLSEPMGRAVFDLGGQWLGPKQHRVQALARELGVETFPTYSTGKNVIVTGGRTKAYRGTIPRISLIGLAGLGVAVARLELLSRRVPADEPWTAADADDLDERTAEHLARTLVRADARASFDAAVRTVFGEEPSALSLLYFAWYSGAGGGFFNLVDVEGGAQEQRFVRGAQALSTELAVRLGAERVLLNSPVTAVIDGEDRVEVRTDQDLISAAYAVVALAPPMLKDIVFTPALPAARQSLNNDMTMGSAVKIVVLYERAFWRTAGFSGEIVYDQPPLSVVFDNTSHDDAQPALVGFVMGDAARDWRELDAPTRRAKLLDALAVALGAEARTPTEVIEKDWDAEPYIGGCPTAIMPPGLLARAGAAMRAPTGRIHWAGTESATEYPGYLEGALQAAERSVDEVIARLDR